MAFVHFPRRPEHLTASFAANEYEQLLRRAEGAELSPVPAGWLALFSDWNALGAYVRGEHSRVTFRFKQDMRDAATSLTEQLFREEVLPCIEAGEAKLSAALLGSRHRAAVAEKYGKQLLRVLGAIQISCDPINAALRVELGNLSNEYDQRLAGATVSVSGNLVSLTRARGLLSSESSALRREAFEAYYGWFSEQRDELAGLFSKLVQRRHAMGAKLGHQNFVPLGYVAVQRIDYGPEQVRDFRDAVREHISPLYRELASVQAAALGTQCLRPWDNAYHPALSLSQGVAEPVAEQLDKADRVFQKLSPTLSGHFRSMRERRLIDFEHRPGKALGAYCCAFPDAGEVAVFCNSIGNDDDVRTLMHELGHAFMACESQTIAAVALRWPSPDASELHSLGLEFLCLPALGEFFAADPLARFTLSRWKRAVELLCYACVVDHFQHWVYENPQASNDERDAQWITFYADYLPGIDWSGVAEPFRACRWYAQHHLFRSPFYYIDYAVAEVGAMQLALLAQANRQDALTKYLALCRLGGTQGVFDLFASAGLRSPFDPTLISELADHARGVLQSVLTPLSAA